MKQKAILGSLLLLSVVACTLVEPQMENTSETPNQIDPNYVSIAEAVDIATDSYNAVYGATRSSRKLSLKGFEILNKANSRSEGDDESYGFYILNFQNNEGFAIVSADRRRENLYAISNEGSLNLVDTAGNPGLSWYLNAYLGGTVVPVTPPTPGLDSTINNLGQPDLYKVYGPFLKGFMSKFKQGEPYNKYCFTRYGEQAKVGCVPLAIGTIMGYYKWPLEYKGVSFNWDEMKEDSEHDGWCRIFEICGRPENGDSDYGEESTGTAPYNITRTFENLNYKGATYSNFNTGVVFDSFRTDDLVMIGGYCSAGGHGWILDGGYVKTKRFITTFPDGYEEVKYYYFHCVWGWEGKGNGFYYLDGNILGGRYDRLDGGSSSPYTFDISNVIYGFKPNK